MIVHTLFVQSTVKTRRNCVIKIKFLFRLYIANYVYSAALFLITSVYVLRQNYALPGRHFEEKSDVSTSVSFRYSTRTGRGDS